MSTSQSVSVKIGRKLRPLRIAFLVDPSRKEQFLNAVRLNTVLWGGQFNPIIPVYRRAPASWADRPLSAPSARNILEGYVRAFDPDIAVNLTNKSISIPGFSEESFVERRLLTPDEFIQTTASGSELQYGLDVTDLYRHLYAEEFRFERRNPGRVVLTEAPDKRMEDLVAACCGEFSSQFQNSAKLYDEAFRPAREAFEGPSLLRLLRDGGTYWPLRIGSAFVDHDRRGFRSGDLTLFLMDATNTLDLLDYWNLRAAGWRALPVPRQWAIEMAPSCVQVVTDEYRPYRHNPKLMHRTTLLKGRSVSQKEVATLAKAMSLPQAGMLVQQGWYPRVWDDWARDKDSAEPAEISAGAYDLEVQVTSNRLVFKDQKPPFVESFSNHGNPRWANVITVDRFDGDPEHAEVFPADIPQIGRALGGTEIVPVRASRYGLVVQCSMLESRHFWNLPSSLPIFEAWAKKEGYSLKLSSPGHVTRQLLRQVGGLYGTWSFADTEVLQLLRRMSDGSTVSVGEMTSRLGNIPTRASSSARLERLVEMRGLKVGASLRCPSCHQSTWYGLGGIRETLECEKCLELFPFPAVKPPRGPWHYRSAGAFSVKDYCLGGFSVALALRFLTQAMHGSSTSVPSFELVHNKKKPLEADFGIFYRGQAWFDKEPCLIFGECKTFDRFEARDVSRLRALGQIFPGAILVVATLNDHLTKAEKRLISPLAMSGRRRWRHDKWRYPVLVLTGTELLQAHAPPYAWEHAGGKYAEFAKIHGHVRDLRDLCDLTQQLHLRLEPYGLREAKEFERVRQRARKKKRVK